MKLIKEIELILDKYELESIHLPDGYGNIYSYSNYYPHIKTKYTQSNVDNNFFKKYGKYIPSGWYGFAIGDVIPKEWIDIINNVLDELIKSDPKFEINQIKMKFGGIRFYTNSEIIEDLFEIERLVELKLFDKALIY